MYRVRKELHFSYVVGARMVQVGTKVLESWVLHYVGASAQPKAKKWESRWARWGVRLEGLFGRHWVQLRLRNTSLYTLDFGGCNCKKNFSLAQQDQRGSSLRKTQSPIKVSWHQSEMAAQSFPPP